MSGCASGNELLRNQPAIEANDTNMWLNAGIWEGMMLYASLVTAWNGLQLFCPFRYTVFQLFCLGQIQKHTTMIEDYIQSNGCNRNRLSLPL